MIGLILGAISAAVSFISSAGATIGPMLANYGSKFLSFAGKYLPEISKTVDAVSTVLDVTKMGETPENLGEKAFIAEKKPENFSNVKDYIQYLSKDVNLDERASTKIDENQKIINQAVGASIMIKGISEKIGSDVSFPFLKKVTDQKLDPIDIIEILKAYHSSDVSNENYDKYVTHTLPLDESDKHSDLLVSAYQKISPDFPIEKIEEKVMKLSNI